MNGLDDLYQEIILDHYKRPRNFGPLEPFDHEAEGHNPLCGDRIQVRVRLDDDGRLAGIGFEGAGCAISTASASMMTEAVRGKSREEAGELFRRFQAMVTDTAPEAAEDDLGDMAALAGVREFPMRIKCATLAWHTLRAALERPGSAVSTEESA